MRPARLLVPFLLLSAGLAARADTISTFNLTGASNVYGLGGDSNTLTGTTTIDVTTGMVQSISVTAGGLSASGVYLQQGTIVYVGSPDDKISFDAGSLINFMGGKFDLSAPNDKYVGGAVLAGAAMTPEPSSILLLTTGLLGLAETARRRWQVRSIAS